MWTIRLSPNAYAENLPYDQLILEKKGKKCWIHVSCKLDLTQNRMKAFKLTI